MYFYSYGATPLGPMLLISDERALVYADFSPVTHFEAWKGIPCTRKSNRVLELAQEEIGAYFAGKLREFTVPYQLKGTLFQEKVWQVLASIPFGSAMTYQEVAELVSSPRAFRAVGQACHLNPLTLIVPCHRIIGKGGRYVGYAGGIDKKAWLLDWEGVTIRRPKDEK